jgi:hypothetical protein
MNTEPSTSRLYVDEPNPLVAAACVRLLSETEVEALAALARDTRRTDDVVVALLSAQTASSRVNLLAAWPRLGARAARRRGEATRQASASAPPWAVLPRRGLPFALTWHAFERFVERHGPFCSRDAAAAGLDMEAAAAARIRPRTLLGQEQWRGPSGVLFVVKRDGRGAPLVCVTVLPRIGPSLIAIHALAIEPDRDPDEVEPDSHERPVLGDGIEPCSSERRRCAR